MKKRAYIKPEISVSEVEAQQMMAASDANLYRHETPASSDFEVLSNRNNRVDLWDN